MKNKIPNIEFFDGLPSREILETWTVKEPGHKLLIMDDLMQNAAKSNHVVDIYC